MVHIGSREIDIQIAILEKMKDGKAWTNAELKKALAKTLDLSPADRQVGERKNEALWENRVNNALGEARPSSLYAKGHVKKVDHGIHMITPAGLAFINEDIDFEDLLNSV